MIKIVKILLVTVGLFLLAYGLLRLIFPDMISDISYYNSKPNTDNSYINLGIGSISILVGLIAKKKKRTLNR
ncbi:hypothetical protein [Tenacibaculum sp. IB213877]|uniref:hypothetical protein n=1 Tax=Tenacibaculum sp. IB213877 TaxID=3097351 RepID=UPI002A5A52DB|nr:hypothetical protein [Tenacibaculum sp. IB213877]MDY0780122.1 hypothetical protein [Tenacibaculum sp. IB213877]